MYTCISFLRRGEFLCFILDTQRTYSILLMRPFAPSNLLLNPCVEFLISAITFIRSAY